MLSRVRKLTFYACLTVLFVSVIASGFIYPLGHSSGNSSKLISHHGSVAPAVSPNVYTPVIGRPGNLTSTLFPVNNTIVPGAQLPRSTLSANPDPASVVYDPVNGIAYVVNYASCNITLVNTTTEKLAGSISNISSPFAALYDPSNSNIYVAGNLNISVIDTVTNTVTKKIACSGLTTSGTQNSISTLTFDTRNNTIFVADTDSHGVSVINGTTNTVVKNFNFNSTSAAPNGVAYDPANNTVYVVDSGLKKIYVVNATDYTQIANFSLPTSTDGGSIFYDPSADTVLVGSLSYFTLLVINPALNNSISVISTNSYPYDMVYDPTNNTMLIEFTSDNSILVMDSTSSIVGNITEFGYSQALAYTGNATQYLVLGLSHASAISIINASTSAQLAVFVFYMVPTMAAYDSNNGDVYVTDSSSNIVYVIDSRTNSTVALIPTPEKPSAIVYDSGNGMIYTGGNYITEINPANNSVSSAIYLGYCIVSMAYDPTNGYIYTSDYSTHSVTAYDPATNSIVLSYSLPLFNPFGGLTEVEGISYDPADQMVYVNAFLSQEVYVLSASTLYENGIISVGSYPTTSAYDPLGQSVYVGSIANGPVTILKGLYSAGAIPSLGGGGGITFNPLNNLMYAASTTLIGGVTYLYAINAYTGTVVGEIPSNSFISCPVYAQSSRTMYAPDGTGQGIYLITGFSPTNYTVSFNETGLPSGTAWYVNVSTGATLSGTNSSLSLNIPNGTYYFTIQSGNKLYGAPSGQFTVSGANSTISVNFSSATFQVTFSQNGLPVGNTWWANITGNPALSSTNSTITTSLVDGTYCYNVSSDNKTWYPVPSSGIVNVNNSAVLVNTSFSEVTYSVTFGPFNLPVGDIMYVNLSNGVSLNATSTSSVTTDLPNGTYTYHSYTNDTRYSATPATGKVSVSGSSLFVPVFFTEAFYNVTFTENDLTAGTTWYVNVTGQTGSGPLSGTSYTISLPNGTYSYTASSANATLKASGGQFTVSGYQYNVTVTFSSRVYDVNFTESNLPSGTVWYVNLSTGLSLESSSSGISTNLSLGTYAYSVATVNKSYEASGGTFTVSSSGSNNITITFNEVKFNVTFSETGLPSGSTWFVNTSSIDSGPVTSTSYTILLMNGSYTFSISTSNKSYVPETPTITVNVSGQSIIETVAFTSSLNTVTFSASGLPAGDTWYVNISNGQKLQTTSNTISVNLALGSYTYTVASGNKTVRPLPDSGNFSITGTNVSVSISFLSVNYTVTFTETGLPSGVSWTVTLSDGKIVNLPGSPVYLVNGTYQYTVKSSNSVYAAPGGSFTVDGKNITVAVDFTQATYTVTFDETGLSPGTLWSVTFNGTQKTSTSGTITFTVFSGNYSYSFNVPSGYYLTVKANGSLSVSGNKTVTGAYLHYSYISVSVNPGNSEVYLNGVLESTNNGNLNITVKGGSYEVEVKDQGYITYYNNFTLNPGQTENLTVVLKAVATPVTGSQFPLNTYEIIAIIAILAIAISLAVVMRRRK